MKLAWLIVVTACASNVQPVAQKPRSAVETPPTATAPPPSSDDGPRYAELLTGEGRGESTDEQPPARPPGGISISSKQALSQSTLTAETVVAKLQTAYLAGIKRCYKIYLANNAPARGKVELELTVGKTGRTVNAKATGFASEVDDCVTAVMGSWRFPIPKDHGGDPIDTSFRITLQLAPA